MKMKRKKKIKRKKNKIKTFWNKKDLKQVFHNFYNYYFKADFYFYQHMHYIITNQNKLCGHQFMQAYIIRTREIKIVKY